MGRSGGESPVARRATETKWGIIAMKAEIPAEYFWLRDALQPHVAQVFAASADKGSRLAIGVTDGSRRYVQVIEGPSISLNARVAGGLTQAAAVQDIIDHLHGQS